MQKSIEKDILLKNVDNFKILFPESTIYRFSNISIDDLYISECLRKNMPISKNTPINKNTHKSKNKSKI